MRWVHRYLASVLLSAVSLTAASSLSAATSPEVWEYDEPGTAPLMVWADEMMDSHPSFWSQLDRSAALPDETGRFLEERAPFCRCSGCAPGEGLVIDGRERRTLNERPEAEPRSILFRTLLVVVGVNLSTVAYWLSLLSPDPESAVNQPPFGTVIRTAQYIGAALLIVYLLQTRLERGSLAEIGLHSGASEIAIRFGRGVLLGGLMVTGLFLVHWAIGCFRFDRYLWETAAGESLWIVLAAGLLFQGGVAFVEELFFRGYFLTYLKGAVGVLPAVVGSSLVFSLVHFFLNVGSFWAFALLPFINLFLAGALLSLLVLRQKSLWVAIGFHYAWNVLQYHAFPVLSGRGLFVFEQVQAFPWFLAGGEFGIEGSILSTLALFVGALYLWRQLSYAGER